MPTKRKRILRWSFALLVVAALVFLVVVTTNFLNEAQMSLGRTPMSGSDLDAMLVNRQQFTPPPDGRLRIAQVHVCLRIAELIDSLDRKKENQTRRRSAIAAVMNTHMQSRASYTWSRNHLATALFDEPMTMADSANIRLIRMMRPRLSAVRRVFNDSLDKEILR